MTNALITLLYLAVAVEFITEALRESIPLLQRLPAHWITLPMGILLCYLTNRGLLAPAGEGFIRCPPADYILTGLLISRGSGMMHDLINAFSNLGSRLLKRI
ncbi:MAG: hypothetical protein GX878_07015 [Firmicutes bacterium]|nr:hypothetical protein [Bacillota bacterium]